MSQTDPFGSPGQPDQQLTPEWLDLLRSVCPNLPEDDSGPEGKPETGLLIPADDPFWDQAAALGYDRPDVEPVFYPPVSDVLMTSFLDSVFGPLSVNP
ncbi:hypothetical protein [Nodosilinea sp. E11]|uniref:hypothetical protein n=1 Tax=Nodosilinea sp. E11 TaxID=3037479 RepID=UPI002934D8BA|nr:hypothetical protein [Nodosilinea sp. E11]WOD37182.1 hypothetical protein RRF56_01615 [Nodosilinea sp. E11]